MSIYAWQLFPLSERRKQMYLEEAERLGITYSELLGLPEPKGKEGEQMKRTLDHCGLISRMGDKECPPRQYDGKCEGYAVSRDNDEPCSICKECKLNVFYEGE